MRVRREFVEEAGKGTRGVVVLRGPEGASLSGENVRRGTWRVMGQSQGIVGVGRGVQEMHEEMQRLRGAQLVQRTRRGRNGDSWEPEGTREEATCEEHGVRE